MCDVFGFPLSIGVAVAAVFIYSMPLNTCTIRERMLYSSCKNPLVDMVENQMQMEIEKKVDSQIRCHIRFMSKVRRQMS